MRSGQEVSMDEAARERLNAEIAEEQERLRCLQELFQGASLPDMADEATHLEAVRFAGALAERSAKRLSALREMAARGAGEVRLCEDCGEPIPASRLLAAPDCVCCRACQAVREGERPRGDED